MFFGNDGAKDKRIAELEARVKELEAKQFEEQVFEEINEVLSQASKGLCDIKVGASATNPKIEQVKNNINSTLDFYSKFADEASEALKEYSDGNFTYEIKADTQDGKVGSVILGIRTLGSSISKLLSLIDVSSKELDAQTKDLNSASNILSEASNKQATRLEETAAALEEITSTIISNSENTAKMSSFANEVIKSAKNGQDMSNETDKAMDEINEQVSSINEAITIIDQIAFQTNILSLNAAVEAATAGEAGKGFAVVAGEVRNLANRSADAAKEIKELVENATEKTKNGKDVAYKMTQGYEKLYENINSTIELINNVSNASKEQQQAIEQINDAITSIDHTSQQNATAASQINSQSGMIHNLSQKLVSSISHTKYNMTHKE